MKEYNLYMVDIVHRLRAKGLAVEWSVYGEGSLRSSIEARIAELNLENTIVLKGALPYERFGEAMQSAYVFVGMGTSIIEAGLCQVPGVPGSGVRFLRSNIW